MPTNCGKRAPGPTLRSTRPCKKKTKRGKCTPLDCTACPRQDSLLPYLSIAFCISVFFTDAVLSTTPLQDGTALHNAGRRVARAAYLYAAAHCGGTGQCHKPLAQRGSSGGKHGTRLNTYYVERCQQDCSALSHLSPLIMLCLAAEPSMSSFL